METFYILEVKGIEEREILDRLKRKPNTENGYMIANYCNGSTHGSYCDGVYYRPNLGIVVRFVGEGAQDEKVWKKVCMYSKEAMGNAKLRLNGRSDDALEIIERTDEDRKIEYKEPASVEVLRKAAL